MAIGGAAALIAPAIQYGLPVAIELAKLTANWIETLNDNPAMTHAEYDEKWAAMKAKYRAATDRHEALRLQGR